MVCGAGRIHGVLFFRETFNKLHMTPVVGRKIACVVVAIAGPMVGIGFQLVPLLAGNFARFEPVQIEVSVKKASSGTSEADHRDQTGCKPDRSCDSFQVAWVRISSLRHQKCFWN